MANYEFDDIFDVLGEFYDAVSSPNIERLLSLLNENPTLLKSKDNRESNDTRNPAIFKSYNALHYAVSAGNKDLCSFLIDKGTPLNNQTQTGDTALHMAVNQADTELVTLLINNGASLEIQDNNGSTALHLALSMNTSMEDIAACTGDWKRTKMVIGGLIQRPRMVDKFLMNPPCNYVLSIISEVTKATGFGQGLDCGGTPKASGLGEDQRCHKISFVHKFVLLVGYQLGITVDTDPEKIVDGFEPEQSNLFLQLLALAAVKKPNSQRAVQHILREKQTPNLNILHFLIEKGARFDIQDQQGSTSLHLAIKTANKDVCTLAIEAASHLDIQDNNGSTALHLAVHRADKNLCTQLIDKGATLDVQDNEGFTPIQLAQNANNEAIITMFEWAQKVVDRDKLTCFLLQTCKPDLALKDDSGITLLMLASRLGIFPTIRSILNSSPHNNASVDFQDSKGRTALMVAVSANNIAACTALIAHNANPNISDFEGASALYLAINNKNFKLTNLLVKSNANILQTLQFANAKNEKEVPEFLLSCGVEISLHQAVNEDLENVIGILMEMKVDVNAQDAEGNTALHVAALSGNADLCRLLILNDADISCPNLQGNSALVASYKFGQHFKVIELLEMAQEGCYFPCWVMEKHVLLSLNSVPDHETARKHGWVRKLLKDVSRQKVMFLSHRWYLKSHPDNKNQKFCGIKQLLANPEMIDVEYVWMDFFSIPQTKEALLQQQSAINSLPYYVRKCQEFVMLIGNFHIMNEKGQDESSSQVYESRGWCRLERFAAASPVIDPTNHDRRLPGTRMWFYDMTIDELTSAPFEHANDENFNPFEGDFMYKSTEVLRIAPMILKLCEYIDRYCGLNKVKQRSMQIRCAAENILTHEKRV